MSCEKSGFHLYFSVICYIHVQLVIISLTGANHCQQSQIVLNINIANHYQQSQTSNNCQYYICAYGHITDKTSSYNARGHGIWLNLAGVTANKEDDITEYHYNM